MCDFQMGFILLLFCLCLPQTCVFLCEGGLASTNGLFQFCTLQCSSRPWILLPLPWRRVHANVLPVSAQSLPISIERLKLSLLLFVFVPFWTPWQVLVAAFAVSGYSSTYYRAGSKPFNPVLGESYECIREDKGFCFFSEQVSLRREPYATFNAQIWTNDGGLITIFNFDFKNSWLDGSGLLTQTQC